MNQVNGKNLLSGQANQLSMESAVEDQHHGYTIGIGDTGSCLVVVAVRPTNNPGAAFRGHDKERHDVYALILAIKTIVKPPTAPLFAPSTEIVYPGSLDGWVRRGQSLEEVLDMEGWVSPRLRVRFSLDGHDLVLYRPDSRRFETFLELEQRAEMERQRAERLAERLRALGVDPDPLDAG